MKISTNVPIITVEPHYSVNFYAELWGLSSSTVLRWFQDRDDVLRISKSPSKKNRERVRVELRIPYSVAMQVYREHQKAA